MTSTCGAIYALATAEPHTASVVSCDRAPNHAGEHCGCSPQTGMLVSWSDKDMPRCLARDVARRNLFPALAPVDCQKPAGHSGLHVGTIDGGVWTWGGDPTSAPASDSADATLPRTVAAALVQVGRAAQRQWPLTGYETADNGNVFVFAIKASPAVIRRTKAAVLSLMIAPEHWREHDAEEGVERNAPAEDRIFEVLKKHEERFFKVTQISRLDMEARRDLEERTRRHCSAIGEAQTLLRTNVHGISTKVDEMRSRIAGLERAVRRRWWQRW